MRVVETVSQAAEELRRGSAVVFPTETVYGVGVAVEYAPSPRALFEAKGRDGSKPVAWLVGSLADIDRYGCDVPEYARSVAKAFWPGPLTVIVFASDAVAPAYRSKAGTIGLRMPANSEALDLLEQVGCPLATTSANRSGFPSSACAAEIDSAFANRVPCMLSSSSRGSGRASTIVDCTGPSPLIVRAGDVSEDAVMQAVLRKDPA